MKILVVDDSRTIRNIIKRTLIDRMEIAEEDIGEAGDGVEAMKLIKAGSFDLYMVDWNMPNMDGFTLLQKIRESGDKTAFMMCTTEAEKLKVLAAIKAGANGYLVKPFTAESIKEKVAQTMEKCAARAS